MNGDANHPLRVFLCHSSGDKEAVRGLYKRLREEGFEPWLDEENLEVGREWEREIPKAVRDSDVVIVCLSRDSVNKKGYVQREIKFALDVADEQPEGTVFIIPLRLEECDVPDRLNRWQWVDLHHERGYERLVKALRERTKSLGASSAGGGVPGGANPSRPRRGKWRLLLFLCLVGLLLVALAFWRKAVEVDISVKASRVSLSVDDPRVNRLFNSVVTKSLAVSTFEKITLPPGRLEATGELDGRGQPVNWRPVPRPAGAENVILPEGALAYVVFDNATLNSLRAPVGAGVVIIWSPDEPDSVKLSFDRAVGGEAAARGELTFSCNQCRPSGLPDDGKAPPTHFRLAAGREGANTISFIGRDDSTEVGLDFPGETKLKEQSIELPGGISFISGEGRPISTLISGKINFEHKVRDEIVLPEGTLLTLELKDATVRAVTVGRGIDIDLHGRAEKLKTGASEKDMKDQRPTVLEWLRANPRLAVLYAALVLVIGLILQMINWWSGSGRQS
jgi:hypothetical protein